LKSLRCKQSDVLSPKITQPSWIYQ